ncbi:unnamed protein product [Rhizophagus irregularis]|nr:unnamed protein product [Rhizophagus irregularis]
MDNNLNPTDNELNRLPPVSSNTSDKKNITRKTDLPLSDPSMQNVQNAQNAQNARNARNASRQRIDFKLIFEALLSIFLD